MKWIYFSYMCSPTQVWSNLNPWVLGLDSKLSLLVILHIFQWFLWEFGDASKNIISLTIFIVEILAKLKSKIFHGKLQRIDKKTDYERILKKDVSYSELAPESKATHCNPQWLHFLSTFMCSTWKRRANIKLINSKICIPLYIETIFLWRCFFIIMTCLKMCVSIL